MQLLGERQPAGILRMGMINHIHERWNLAPGVIEQRDAPYRFAVHFGYLFARPQIGDRPPPFRRANPIDDAATSTAAIQPKHEAGLFRRPAMDERVDAQGAVQPGKTSRNSVEGRETRPPDQ